MKKNYASANFFAHQNQHIMQKNVSNSLRTEEEKSIYHMITDNESTNLLLD